MTGTPAPSSDPVSPAAEARALVERQIAMLGELAEAGLEAARAVARQARGELETPVAHDIALAYSRVSRAVRMTLALQSKLLEGLHGLEAAGAGRAAGAAEDRKEERFDLDYCRKTRIEAIVERVAVAEHADDEAEADRLTVEATERLDDFDRYEDLLTRPFSEAVAILCKDLGLTPDWTALAQEAWARAEIDSGAPGEPLRALGLTPRPPRPGAPPRPSPEALDIYLLGQLHWEDRREQQEAEIKARPPPAPPKSPWGSVAAEKQALAGAKRALGLAYPGPE